MDNLTIILAGIVVLFFLLLGIKSLLSENHKKRFCVICLSVSLTWIVLIILYFLNLFNNNILIALLMGMSVTGIFYYLESKLKKNDNLKIFRLPFILTLISAVYFLLDSFSIYAFYFIIFLWILFGFLYSFKNSEGFSTLVNKLIECCKRW